MWRTYNGKQVEFKGQQELIYKHLKSQGSITQLEALGVFGIYRLAARVCEMRRKGVPIDSENKKDVNGKVYANYFLNDGYQWRQPVGSSKALNSLLERGTETVPFELENGYKITLRDNEDGTFNVRVYCDDSMGQNLLSINPTRGTVKIVGHFHDREKIPELELV